MTDAPRRPDGVVVNDAQSRLNETRVAAIAEPVSEEHVCELVAGVAAERGSLAIAGGRHAMGGQQFATGALLLDMRSMGTVVDFDRERGLVEVEAGIEWPELIEYLHREQDGDRTPWAIRQKQTGVDRVTLGGSLAANAHGRGLRFPPIVSDVESLVLVGPDGEAKRCSRTENPELFSLAVGGYGLFGVITRVTLRLVPRCKVRRTVMVIPVRDLLDRLDERLRIGAVYGDCQYSVDLAAEPGAHPGVFSSYVEVDDATPIPEAQRQLSPADWAELYRLVRTDKQRAFQVYSMYYLGTSGQVYWSDLHQLSKVFEGYADVVSVAHGTEMITELYVPRDALVSFLGAARADAVQHGFDVTFGTIRFIEPDTETFLAWATQPWACVVCNLHVMHTPAGLARAEADFRRLIDRALEVGGRFFLTYHRWASPEQIARAYPGFEDFLARKQERDPEERFTSDWYRHYRAAFG